MAQNYPAGFAQVLVHVPTYQGNPFGYRFFEAQPGGTTSKVMLTPFEPHAQNPGR